MMASLRFAAHARQDMIDIFDYIAGDKPVAALKWIDTIEAKCELLSSQPEIGQKRPEFGADIRSSIVGRYVVFYRAITDGIEVVRVVSGNRNIQSL